MPQLSAGFMSFVTHGHSLLHVTIAFDNVL